jgi:hypothetical protein
MAKRNIEMVALEAASFVAEVKEAVGGSIMQARNLAEIGRAAYDTLFELGSDAHHDELRSHAVRLRGAAVHSLLCSCELTAGAARLEQLAAVREAAHHEDDE